MIKSKLTIIKEYLPINKMAEIILINKIFIYSATKRSAKPPPPYSTLNPETSSDSPSAKSKGARFVSARVVINQRITVGNKINKNQIWGIEKEKNEILIISINGASKIKAMEIS